ncbi:hypothetical protein HDU98_004194, partial [Podochytrium sp. JEL0797]
MDASGLQQLHAALAAIHDPSSTNATRRAAQQHLDALKTTLSAFELARLGLQLSNEGEIALRFFGLSLVEFVLRLAWEQLDAPQVLVLRDDLVALLFASTANPGTPPFVKEKTCALVAQMAERIWPLHWPEFDKFLRDFFHASSASQEAALLIYKSLVEDTFCFENSIAELRKKDLSMSLIAITVDSAVLNSVYRHDRESTAVATQLDVDVIMNLIRADPHNEGWLHRLINNLVVLKRVVAEPELSHAKKLIHLELDVISTVFQWVILEGIQSSGVLPFIFELLLSPSPEERIDAADCLISLLGRSSLVAEEKFWPVIVTPLFGEPFLLGTLFNAILGTYKCADWSQIYTLAETTVLSEDEYLFLKSLAEVVAAFGERQMFYKQMTQKPVRFESFLELLVFFTTHPARMISSTAAPVWSDLAAHEHFKKTPEVYQSTGRLLNFCIARISEGDSDFITPTAKEYDEVEFGDEADKKACMDSNRVRYLDILKFIATIQPFELYASVDSHIRQLVFSNHPTTPRNEFGFLLPKTQAAIQFEQTPVLIEHVMKHIPNVLDPNLKDPRLLVSVSKLFADVINLDAKDPAIVRCILSVVVCIAESVRDDASLLKSIEK